MSLVLGTRLLRSSAAPRRMWAVAILLTAVAAACGGTEHGYRPWLAPGTRRGLWHVTYAAIGTANALLVVGAARLACGARVQRVVTVVALLRLAVFLVLVSRDPRFVYVILDFALTLLVLAGLAAWGRGRPWAAWVAGAVAMSVAGAAVQATGLSLHTHFNHNDLFHGLQTLGVVCFFEAARRFPPDA